MNRKYTELHKNGELKKRISKAISLLENCKLCPRKCGVNRLKEERGFCGTGRLAIISSYGPHFGEESPLTGNKGSGTIFVGGCNLKCIFCQNYEISHVIFGEEMEPQQIAQLMIKLQNMDCHNINIVTPTHVAPQILEALPYAIEKGLNIPLIYNTGSYDNELTLKLLDGIFDIYMPDFKFWNSSISSQFTGTNDYPQIAQTAIKEMHKQVGDLIIADNGIAQSGLLVRHLVLPGGIAETEKVAKFLASLSSHTYVNVMSQYKPYGNIESFPALSKKITNSEFDTAIKSIKNAGLYRLI